MFLRYHAPATLSDTLGTLVNDKVASRIAVGDPTVWGPAAEEESAKRLGWVGLPESSRPLLAEIEALHAQLREEGLTRVVLAGMGGSSLAPEVICKTAGVDLVTLDTTDPQQVADALAQDIEQTVVVVSSKSGGTVETDSHRRTAEKAFSDAGIDAASRIIVVTDPGSPFEKLSAEAGYRKVFLADPTVGGRYSALTAFGLVPSGLAGADIAALLDDAAYAQKQCAKDAVDNPALLLGAVLGDAEKAGSEKVVFAPDGTANDGFADWVEQLLAESTGKEGRGVLPVALSGTGDVGYADAGPDAVPVALGEVDAPRSASGYSIATDGPLGAQFYLWEFATAVAGAVIGINPFDQPNVEEAKVQARKLLDGSGPADDAAPLFTDGAVQVYADGDWAAGQDTLSGVLGALLQAEPKDGYVAIMAYLDRHNDRLAADLRALVARASGKQTTFGWGPRFLHSTGQYHKGGHPNGAFLQITADAAQDLPIPGQPFTFHTLQLAQASGDAAVLKAKGRPVLRLHLTDRGAGLDQVAAAVEEMSS